MKKIYNILLATVALLAFAPTVIADGEGEGEGEEQEVDYTINGQIKDAGNNNASPEFPEETDTGVHNDEINKVAYSKNISKPFSDGTYWIKLETWATGSAAQIITSTPSDIILILDSSTSMDTRDYNYGTSGRITRLAALQEATKDFIESIWKNDSDVTAVDPSYPGNRISIITYDDNPYTLSNQGVWRQGTSDNKAIWFDIGANGVKETLKNAVDNINTHNWTRPDRGMEVAIRDLLSGNTDATKKRDDANLIVVMFTDGVPAHSQGQGNTFENEDANKAIIQGYQLKKTYGAALFTVGLISPTSTDQNIRKGRYFLDLLSSNYPDAQVRNNSNWTVSNGTVSVTNLTGTNTYEDGEYYQLVDENTDLSSIFDAIAQQSGGSANQSLSAATSTVDIVSNSFILPDGANSENIEEYIKVFTAKLNRIENGKYIFDPEVLVDHSDDEYYALDDNGAPTGNPLDVDENIGVELIGTNGIKVTGFDYSGNFCGPIYENGWNASMPGADDHIDHYQGHKVIIMIPIKMNPDAVGGPNVSTNGDGSGIILEGQDTPLVPFESPTVSLPVNIYIKKTGLNHGESAKFKIERADLPADGSIPESGWTYVSSIFVTQPETANDEDPVIVKVKGLPANRTKTVGYIYRVTEEEWAWSYNRDETPQYTVTSKVDNPFTFDNSIKDDIEVKLHHAESKVNNVFKKTAASKEYNDSKTNTRE